MLIGINGGNFPAICRVCFFYIASSENKREVYHNEMFWTCQFLSLSVFVRLKNFGHSLALPDIFLLTQIFTVSVFLSEFLLSK